ncbi:MAG: PASTA domain-containing protein, partial [Demequina sp.]
IDPATGAHHLGSAAMGAGAAGVAAAGFAHGMTPEQIEEQPTQLMSSVNGPPATGSTEVMPPGMGPGGAAWGPTGSDYSLAPQSSGQIAVEDEELISDEDERKRRIRQYLILAGAAIGAILLIIALFAIAGGGDEEPEPEFVVVPNLLLDTEDEARTTLEGLGLVPEFVEETSDEVPEGRVIRTEPAADEEVEPESTVTVVMSLGEDVVVVPDVTGLEQDVAVERLEAEGLRVTTFEIDNDPDLEEGRATRTDPEQGEEVPRDSGVVLYVASGQVELPDLVGTSEEGARAELADLNLRPRVEDVETDEERPGTVLSQSPGPGLVDRGSEVTIKVAVEPSTQEVPNVVGKTQSDAQDTLNNEGFDVTVEEQESETVAEGKVIQQNPSAGTEVAPGSTVTITVSTGPPDSGEPSPTPEE